MLYVNYISLKLEVGERKKLSFSKHNAGILSYLDGKTFQVEKVDFAQEYFPGAKLPK